MSPRNAQIQQVQPQSDSTFYVHPSDGPDSVATIMHLDRNNYETYSKSMHKALKAKNKLPIINDSLTIPDFDDLN